MHTLVNETSVNKMRLETFVLQGSYLLFIVALVSSKVC